MDNTYDCNTNTFNNLTSLTASSFNYTEAAVTYTGAYQPFYATGGSAGVDLATTSDFVIEPHAKMKIPLGIKMSIPVGYVGLLIGRSSMGAKGLVLANAVGVIDSDYRGEIIALMHNTNNFPVSIMKGDRIAQLLIMPVAQPKFVIANELDDTARGTGGFGSTGE
jgi:dUTP pyrophosphatase